MSRALIISPTCSTLSEIKWHWLSAAGAVTTTRCRGLMAIPIALATAPTRQSSSSRTSPTMLVKFHQLISTTLDNCALRLSKATAATIAKRDIASGLGLWTTLPDGIPRMPRADANKLLQEWLQTRKTCEIHHSLM